MFVKLVDLAPQIVTQTSGSRCCNRGSSSCLRLLILGEKGPFGPGRASRLVSVLTVHDSQLLGVSAVVGRHASSLSDVGSDLPFSHLGHSGHMSAGLSSQMRTLQVTYFSSALSHPGGRLVKKALHALSLGASCLHLLSG